MNRFDRVVSIWMLLQSRRLITAHDMADQFEVSIRTIYRDIRTLELAGVPIRSEAGVGYSLDRGYKLPPVIFDREEALALFMAEKFMKQSSDATTREAYLRALTKIRTVLNDADKDHLDGLDRRIKVQASDIPEESSDPWLMEVQHAVSRSQVIRIDYFTPATEGVNSREVEPLGLYFYARHWHLIAWCRLRRDYRDFRLDRIQRLISTGIWFDQSARGDLDFYLDHYLLHSAGSEALQKVEVIFSANIAAYTHIQRYWYGFVQEQALENGDMRMTFLTTSLEYFSRWIISYTDSVKIEQPEALKTKMLELLGELQASLLEPSAV